MRYKLIPESKESTYDGGKYQYSLHYLSSDDVDARWVWDRFVYARSIESAKAEFLASQPEKELQFSV